MQLKTPAPLKIVGFMAPSSGSSALPENRAVAASQTYFLVSKIQEKHSRVISLFMSAWHIVTTAAMWCTCLTTVVSLLQNLWCALSALEVLKGMVGA